MDKDTRNAIERATQRARKLLEEDFAAQLEGDFDVHRDGTVAAKAGGHLSARKAFQRERIVAAIEHKRAAGMSAADSARDYLRDAAFTTLNRFVALKMLEARDLVQECITKGEQSAGYREFCGMAPGLPLLPDSTGYRLYIESLFDELSTEVKVLFDRRDPSSVLWPKRATFERLLEILNAMELSGVWGEDETIGWVYQFFNGKEERAAMRDVKQGGSQAPRNSRELAVRNQFFTPRYVVQFLTDNTLGRIWWEMRGTNTALADRCEYMVRKPGEAVAPRPKKDPRDLRVLDPACGSGHFLLYAFDLLLAIYEEAYADPEGPKSEATGKTLAEDYPSDALRKAVPGLVLAHNLHGVDIDPRCAQIAQLALWMRAQKAYRDFNIGRAERPQIRRSNIVVAEPVPWSDDLLADFFSGSEDPTLRHGTLELVEQMTLAGVLGLLLRLEPRSSRIGDGSMNEQLDLFAPNGGRVREQVRQLAIEAASRGNARLRLFADDAAQGVGFLELASLKYDVIVMNPPFGEPAAPARQYVAHHYPYSRTDLGMMMVERGVSYLRSGGCLGAITNRVFVANDKLSEWRGQFMLGERSSLTTFLDLGWGVMDDALVEAAAFTLAAGPTDGRPIPFVRVLDEKDKLVAVDELFSGRKRSRTFVFDRMLTDFVDIPGRVLAYQLPASLVRRITSGLRLKAQGGNAVQGLIPGDDFRFLRLAWEVPFSSVGRNQRWVFYAKGGEYRPYWDDMHLVVNWAQDGREIRSFVDERGEPRSRPRGMTYYYREGATYPERTTSDFSPRVLPRDCIFSAAGQAVFTSDESDTAGYIAGAYSRPFKLIVDAFYGSGDSSVPGSAATHYRCGVLQRLPPPLPVGAGSTLSAEISTLLITAAQHREFDETSRLFRGLADAANREMTFAEFCENEATSKMLECARMMEAHLVVEEAVCRALNFNDEDRVALNTLVGPHPLSYRPDVGSDEQKRLAALWELPESDLVGAVVASKGARRQLTKLSYIAHRRLELVAHDLERSAASVAFWVAQRRLVEPGAKRDTALRILQYLVGCAFGRWDLRRAWASKEEHLASPFEPLPACPPGALSRAVARDYPIRIALDGILADDHGQDVDIARRVLQVAAHIWREGDAMVGDALREVQSKALHADVDLALREWLAGHFFSAHIGAYSNSRRNAPIYWQLATPSAGYSVWLYIHAFSKDTLFRVQNDYVAPKLAHAERRLESLTSELRDGATAAQRKQLAAQEGLVEELRAFLDEVRRLAPLWKPNLDDGVIINFAPLWRLVPQNKSWQKELKSTWDALCEGKYDWAHLAMHLWPERVVPKCARDRSLAIAHGLEEVFWVEGTDGKWTARKAPTRTVDELVRERTSPAVKSALKSLREVPAAAGKSGGRRGGGGRRKSAAAGEGGHA